MKTLRCGRMRLSVWRHAVEGIAELLPYVLLTAMWRTAWFRSSCLTVEIGWLRWNVGVTVEVRHV